MNTHCQIGIYESADKPIEKFDVLLYRHCDGYPDGILPDIVPFLKAFDAKRGINDTEYCGAWLMHHLIARHCENMAEYFRTDDQSQLPKNLQMTTDGHDFLGHGISRSFYRDIEYFYKVSPTQVDVYNVPLQKQSDKLWIAKWKLIKTIVLCSPTIEDSKEEVTHEGP